MNKHIRRTAACAFLLTVIVLTAACACLWAELNTGGVLHGNTATASSAWPAQLREAVTAAHAYLPPRAAAVVSLFRAEAAALAALLGG